MIGPAHFICLVSALSAVAPLAQPARGDIEPAYVWERVADRYGWSRKPVYVLILVVFQERLWAFEADAVHWSRDGRKWTTATSVAEWDGTVAFGNMVVHAGRMWALGGFTEAGSHSEVWSSADGWHWTRVARAPWSSGHVNVVFGGRIWVLGGRRGAEVWSSRDGISSRTCGGSGGPRIADPVRALLRRGVDRQ